MNTRGSSLTEASVVPLSQPVIFAHALYGFLQTVKTISFMINIQKFKICPLLGYYAA
jgi:hypothetical protein